MYTIQCRNYLRPSDSTDTSLPVFFWSNWNDFYNVSQFSHCRSIHCTIYACIVLVGWRIPISLPVMLSIINIIIKSIWPIAQMMKQLNDMVKNPNWPIPQIMKKSQLTGDRCLAIYKYKHGWGVEIWSTKKQPELRGESGIWAYNLQISSQLPYHSTSTMPSCCLHYWWSSQIINFCDKIGQMCHKKQWEFKGF